MAFDRVNERVPEQYIKNAIASGMAAKMVYKEGTNFIDSLSADNLAKTALMYVGKEKEIEELKTVLTGTDMPSEEKARILDLLEAGGARTALSLWNESTDDVGCFKLLLNVNLNKLIRSESYDGELYLCHILERVSKWDYA